MPRNLNFIPRKNNLRLLQAGTFAALLGCVAMLTFVLSGSDQENQQTASIADTLPSPLISSSPSEIRSMAKPKAISENPVISAALGTAADTVRYYEASTGKAFSVNTQTLRTDVLSDQRLPGFLQSWWAPRADRVISSFQQSDGVKYRFYDYATKKTSALGISLTGIAISPDGKDVAYLENDGDALTLYIADIDGSNPRSILKTRTQETRLTWPTKDRISLSSRRSDRPGYDLSFIDPQGNLAPVLTNKENLEYLWSGDGSQLLYSYFLAGDGISLWIHDVRNGSDMPLGVSTSARKCALHQIGLFATCGVPTRSTQARDVPADHSATIDDIVTVDLLSGQQRRLYGGTSGSLIGVIDPIISSSERYFVFTNLFDKRLYGIPL